MTAVDLLAYLAQVVSTDLARVPLWFDLTAVAVGAIQGAAFAMFDDGRNNYDVSAALVFAVVVGLGGGIIRDVLLNQVPAALRNDWYVIVAVVAGIGGMLLARAVQRLHLFVDLLDAAVLGVFVVVGVVKASNAGLGAASSILLGTITGVGGGVLRDLLAHQPVSLIQRTAPYGLVAIGAAGLFVGLAALGLPTNVSALITFVVVVAVRMAALLRGWQTPRPPTIPPVGPLAS